MATNRTPSNRSPSTTERLIEPLRELRLPTFREHFPTRADRAAKEERSDPQDREALTSRECEARSPGRIRRRAQASRLLAGMTWDPFPWPRGPTSVPPQWLTLRGGAFRTRRENVLVFGQPGSGKTHARCALGEQLGLRGHSVLFATCRLLVQDLLVAKRDRKRERVPKKWSGFEAVMIDDLGYVQQSRAEVEVRFTLPADRDERASVRLSSNLPSRSGPKSSTTR